MKLPRRKFLNLAASSAALTALSRISGAQAYPSRAVRIIVGGPPGGPTDIAARLISQWLSARLGQPFVVDNRPGAGGNIAAEAVVRAPADGYTLLLVYASSAINATLYERLDFNFIRDIAPVASINRTPLVLEVHPSFPAKSVPELIAYTKANPGAVNLALPVIGSGPYMAGELFKMMAGVNMVSVAYRGSGPMLNDLLGNQVQVAFDGVLSSIQHIRAGRLRALGVASAARLEALPDIPIIADFVPGFEATGWNGIGVPRNTSVEIVDRLNKEINAGLVDPNIKARLADLGTTPLISSSAEFGRFIADETEKWAKVVKFSGVKPE
ncbi:MAG TPA: tripartite tricarboxylate transporter substrate binding protein [Xanthobacteraceae bacterium]|nr:tripartite tricarboxylate transporter substrate binding protein [Xanthobacteraceae bacterium]